MPPCNYTSLLSLSYLLYPKVACLMPIWDGAIQKGIHDWWAGVWQFDPAEARGTKILQHPVATGIRSKYQREILSCNNF